MKTLVLWSSRTGNTKAVAQAIYDALPGDKDMIEEGREKDTARYDPLAPIPIHRRPGTIWLMPPPFFQRTAPALAPSSARDGFIPSISGNGANMRKRCIP